MNASTLHREPKKAGIHSMGWENGSIPALSNTAMPSGISSLKTFRSSNEIRTGPERWDPAVFVFQAEGENEGGHEGRVSQFWVVLFQELFALGIDEFPAHADHEIQAVDIRDFRSTVGVGLVKVSKEDPLIKGRPVGLPCEILVPYKKGFEAASGGGHDQGLTQETRIPSFR